MIPVFPEFKQVDSSDRQAVESHTHRFPPYSDINFVSLWTWDVTGERKISELNGNLVILFTDYKTHKPVLSFLGINGVPETIKTLLKYSEENALPAQLKLIPEVSLEGSDSSNLHIEEDRDNFDYIYSVAELSKMTGGKFKGRRNFVNKFMTEHPTATFHKIDLTDPATHEKIMSVIEARAQHKVALGKVDDNVNEEKALQRLFESTLTDSLVGSAVIEQGRMIAFSIEEILPNSYCLSHFWKGDTAYPGVYDFLMQQKCRNLETLGVTYLNYEQDLGIEGLRRSKMDYQPVDFLRKYSIVG